MVRVAGKERGGRGGQSDGLELRYGMAGWVGNEVTSPVW